MGKRKRSRVEDAPSSIQGEDDPQTLDEIQNVDARIESGILAADALWVRAMDMLENGETQD